MRQQEDQSRVEWPGRGGGNGRPWALPRCRSCDVCKESKEESEARKCECTNAVRPLERPHEMDPKPIAWDPQDRMHVEMHVEITHGATGRALLRRPRSDAWKVFELILSRDSLGCYAP